MPENKKKIVLVLEKDLPIKVYADMGISQEDIIIHLENTLHMMKNKPGKGIFYTKGTNK